MSIQTPHQTISDANNEPVAPFNSDPVGVSDLKSLNDDEEVNDYSQISSSYPQSSNQNRTDSYIRIDEDEANNSGEPPIVQIQVPATLANFGPQ